MLAAEEYESTHAARGIVAAPHHLAAAAGQECWPRAATPSRP